MDEIFLKLFDKFSEQNIEEGVFYTLVKGNITVYMTHYTKLYDADDYDNDEAVVSVFKDGLNILRYGGDLESVLREIRKLL